MKRTERRDIKEENCQKEIVKYLANGDTYNEISRKTNLSKYEVQNCLKLLYQKFGVPNRVALAYTAVRVGFID